MENQLKTSENINDWANTFNIRTLNLLSIESASLPTANNRAAINRSRSRIISNAAKSLNILRISLQNTINKDINIVMQKYIDTYFIPSITNIKKNFGNNSVSEVHLQAVCRQVLEEAKKMFNGSGKFPAVNSPLNSEPTENGSDNENANSMQITGKRKAHNDCDSDADSISLPNSQNRLSKKKKLKSSPLVAKVNNKAPTTRKLPSKANNADSVRREGPRWDSNRLSTDTKFVLGSKANKALGFGATRGRLYTKHADIFRYIGDQEDKQWLNEHGLMPPAGGRAYLIIKEDIEDLLKSDEYKDAPGVEVESMGAGFTVPSNMIEKMKKIMEAMRNGSVSSSNGKSNKAKDKESPSSRSTSPAISKNTPNTEHFAPDSIKDSNQPSVDTNHPESRAISPVDELDYLNSNQAHSANPSPSSLNTSNLSPNVNNAALSPSELD